MDNTTISLEEINQSKIKMYELTAGNEETSMYEEIARMLC